VFAAGLGWLKNLGRENLSLLFATVTGIRAQCGAVDIGSSEQSAVNDQYVIIRGSSARDANGERERRAVEERRRRSRCRGVGCGWEQLRDRRIVEL
jgi:hypothetical protein